METDHGSSINDDQQTGPVHEYGLNQGNAARTGNSPREERGRKGGPSPPYEEWSKESLYARAREVWVEGRTNMTKKELIKALRDR